MRKKRSPGLYWGSYELGKENWQAVACWDDKQEAIETVKWHSQGRRWFVY